MAVDRDKVLQAAQKLVERKRYDKAIIEYQKLVADDPKDVRTLLKIGDLYLKMEEYAEAITTYERVGEFYSGQGFAVKAIAVYKQIREIINKYVPHLADRFGHIVPRLAEIYAQLGLTSDAIATYDEVAGRLQKAGRDRDAIDVFRKIADLDPQNPLPYLRLADALVRIKDFDGAMQRFGMAAELLLKLGRRDDALKVLERLLQHRTDARFARMAAEIYLDRGDANDGMAALAKLQIAFKENPKDLQTLTLLARAFDLLGQPAKAIEVQKASARTAKEAGRVDQFAAIVTSLLVRAPDDDEVRALAAQLAPATTSAAANPRDSIDIRIEDSGAEELDISEEEEEEDLNPPSAVPIPLRASQVAVEPYDPAAMARQIIGQADAMLRAGQVGNAIALLRSGVQRLPSSRDIRERLCTVLYDDAQDQDGAIQAMLDFAHMLVEEGDVAAAVQKLDEVRLIDNGNAHALQMLAALGYAVQEPYVEPQPEVYETYPPAPQPKQAIDEIDDPFAAEPLPQFPPPDSERLPQYTIDDDDLYNPPAQPVQPPVHAPPMARPGHHPAPPQQQVYAPAAPQPQPQVYARPAQPQPVALRAPQPPQPPQQPYPPPFVPPPPPSMGGSRAQELDEDALEEAEFYAQRQMFEDARNVLTAELARLPNHPLLLERLREVDALEAQATGATDNQSGTRPRLSEDEDPFWKDIDNIVDNLDPALGQAPAQAASDQVSAEEVFNQFKAGVAAQISESDAATHYDLGVAYKEMGLLPDAIREFELATRDPGRECVCQSMIGVIHLQMGNVEAAIDAFILGLRAQQKTVEQELALNYEIASAYETRGDRGQALYYFQRVSRLNPTYNDPRGNVADRVRRLEEPKPVARAAVGAELLGDDFDAAFDDLLSRAKLP